MKISMKHPDKALIDACGRSVLTAAEQDARIAELERENASLRRIIKARLTTAAPAQTQTRH